MWGMTPPPAMVALISVSSSSSPERKRHFNWSLMKHFIKISLISWLQGHEISLVLCSPTGYLCTNYTLHTSDGELQMAGSDPLHLEILRGVASQLKDLGGEVLQDGGAVHGGGGTNTSSGEAPALEMTMDPGKRKFIRSLSRYFSEILRSVFANYFKIKKKFSVTV